MNQVRPGHTGHHPTSHLKELIIPLQIKQSLSSHFWMDASFSNPVTSGILLYLQWSKVAWLCRMSLVNQRFHISGGPRSTKDPAETHFAFQCFHTSPELASSSWVSPGFSWAVAGAPGWWHGPGSWSSCPVSEADCSTDTWGSPAWCSIPQDPEPTTPIQSTAGIPRAQVFLQAGLPRLPSPSLHCIFFFLDQFG